VRHVSSVPFAFELIHPRASRRSRVTCRGSWGSENRTLNTHKRKAFTLIELLVVIAIIAVLAALLMPAMKNALAAARTVTCASNLRQIQLAAVLYLRDHGVFPPHYDYRDRNNDGIADGPLWYYDGPTLGVHYTPFFGGPYLGENILTGPSRGAGSVYDCPLLDGMRNGRNHQSYGINMITSPNNVQGQMVGMEEVAKPTETFTFTDSWNYGITSDRWSGWYWARPLFGVRYHEDERFNAAFVDGHVLSLYKEQVDDSNFEVQ
jgi:prepilin-type N-terminal cleavage/methylation domain-containing protein/prepilin-type processing-associated H-X9-DG protein